MFINVVSAPSKPDEGQVECHEILEEVWNHWRQICSGINSLGKLPQVTLVTTLELKDKLKELLI